MEVAMFFAIFGIGGLRVTLAQSCPPSITAVSQLKQDMPGWVTKPVEATHDLLFVSIITGPLKPVPDQDPENLLAPVEINNVQIWPLGKIRENDEVWMRCGYSETSIKLSTRVHVGMVECFQKTVHLSKEHKKEKIVATCADEYHKNLPSKYTK